MDFRTAARWLERLSPWAVDAGLASVLAGVALTEIAVNADCAGVTVSDTWWSVAFTVAITFPLSLRRRHPFAVMVAVGVPAAVYNVVDIPPDPYTLTFAILVAVYSVSAYARRPLAVAAAVTTAAVLVLMNLPVMPDENDFADVVNQFVLLGGGWIAGQNTRYRRRQARLLRERAERAEREQQERGRVAILEERGRLAREIHDVIAHSVGVIAVQAGAARAVAEQRPDRARETLATIEKVSKDTLVELRRALGALRATGQETDLRPAPGLAALDELVEKVRGAGVTVSVREQGERRDLPPGVDLSAYRVVQEALTNTVKHSGSPTAHVTIRYGASSLEVRVTDDGGSSPARALAGVGRGSQGGGHVAGGHGTGGHGLIGMRERVAMLEGEFEAGATETGFAVRARFPLTGAGEGR
ncbi:sensor histidine kinase [Streptosporangium sp. NPDC000396]|uniref:sensor histidine kinase n=1 Tax=Streptosporangium sp. NPDC000396 TaxID=3366185 RepID=UPI00368490F3